MVRKSVNKEIKCFVRWAQKDRCLLCSFRLRFHFHHVIAVDEGGPDHPLNLVALCPNHHSLVEHIKRYIIHTVKRDSQVWLNKAKIALEVLESLNEESKTILKLLTEPYSLRFLDTIEDVKNRRMPQKLIVHFTRDLIDADLKILDSINRKRPRIFLNQTFGSISTKTQFNLYDLLLIDDIHVQNQIDEKASQIVTIIGKGAYADVISAHMRNLDLPYEAICA